MFRLFGTVIPPAFRIFSCSWEYAVSTSITSSLVSAVLSSASSSRTCELLLSIFSSNQFCEAKLFARARSAVAPFYLAMANRTTILNGHSRHNLPVSLCLLRFYELSVMLVNQVAVICGVRSDSRFRHATKGTIFLDLYRGGSIFQKPFACFCVTAL
jgi:hypothetical protein